MPKTQQVAHTPGPWKLVDLRHQKSSTIRIFSDGHGRVANVLTGSGFVRTERANDCEANARLIAAAPELLSEARINLGVLKEVHAYLRNRTGNLEVQLCEMVGESISHSEAAISKAETGQ